MNERREIWQFYANCLKGTFLALNLLAINIMTMDNCPLTALANIVQIITIIHIATAVSVCTIRALSLKVLRKHINNSEKLKESSILSRVDPFINLIKRVLTILIPWCDDDLVVEGRCLIIV